MADQTSAKRETLPRTVVPHHYDLLMEPDLEKFTYSGVVKIELEVVKRTYTVVLNATQLDLKSARIGAAAAVSIAQNDHLQQATIKFSDELEPGQKVVLEIAFTGELNDQMCGFYRSVHQNQVVACTQMEATECRRAFPCFDEPALKATFDISIAAQEKYTVLSNSDLRVREKSATKGKDIWHFNRTPPMSTYLVAFVVGELAHVQSNLFRVPVRVYCTAGMEEQCRYAADLAANTLAFFENAFGIEYPLPKCDMVGLHDFAAGAMENWGLITYRLTALLYTEGRDSLATKQRVTEVVQHELAHQWFGNLVTMEWWDGLWLNEGFATWMSWYACNAFYPEWRVWEQFINGTYESCLQMDSLPSTHPIEVPVQRAGDVDEIFDAISYSKGSCVIRMVSNMIGLDVFLKGITNYLTRHQYGNTTTDDLWNALSEASGVDVASIMGIWTRTAGYPILTVSPSSGSDEFKVEQHRYFGAAKESSKQVYPTALYVRGASGDVDRNTMLTDKELVVKLPNNQPYTKFFKLNADQSGIYRVKYPEDVLQNIILEGSRPDSKLSGEDKLGLLGDLEALAGIEVSAKQVVDLARAWNGDRNHNVVIRILQALGGLASILHYQPADIKQKLNKFRQQFVEPLLAEHGYDFVKPCDPVLRQLKAALFASAISAGSEKYIQVALDLFAKDKFSVPADIRQPIFKAVAERGDVKQWEELFAYAVKGEDPEGSVAALASLGLSPKRELVEKVLKAVLDGGVRMQDAVYAVSGCFRNSELSEVAWKWFTSNYKQIEKKFPVSGRILGGIIGVAVAIIYTTEHVKEVDAFFKGRKLPGNERLYATSRDRLGSRVAIIAPIVKQLSEI